MEIGFISVAQKALGDGVSSSLTSFLGKAGLDAGVRETHEARWGGTSSHSLASSTAPQPFWGCRGFQESLVSNLQTESGQDEPYLDPGLHWLRSNSKQTTTTKCAVFLLLLLFLSWKTIYLKHPPHTHTHVKTQALFLTM